MAATLRVRPTHTNLRTGIVAGAVVVGLVGGGALVLRSTDAAFTANVDNGPNVWSAASVSITSDLGATVMFNPAVNGKLVPGTTLTRCIEVQYTGDVAAPVKLFTSAITDSASLGSALSLVIDEGTGTAGINCAGYTNAANVYTGTVAGFATAHNSFATGAGSWTTPASAQNKMYRFTVTLPSNAQSTLQGASLTSTFRWETQAGS